jgi:hypothetical protein
MPVDNIRSPSKHLAKNCPEEKEIKGNLVERRTNLVVFAKRNAEGSSDTQACQILPVAICTGPYPVSEPL